MVLNSDVEIMAKQRYITIGPGVFGVLVTLSLIKKDPSASVRLINDNSGRSASYDTIKVVRNNYRDQIYAKLGLESMKIWETKSLYMKYCHKTPLVWIFMFDQESYLKN